MSSAVSEVSVASLCHASLLAASHLLLGSHVSEDAHPLGEGQGERGQLRPGEVNLVDDRPAHDVRADAAEGDVHDRGEFGRLHVDDDSTVRGGDLARLD